MRRRRVTKRGLFVKYAVTYITIVGVLFCATMLLHGALFSSGKENELTRAQDRLDNAINILSQKLLSLRDTSMLMNVDYDYTQLFLLSGAPPASYVPNMIAAQKSLKQIKTSQSDDIIGCYLAFINSPMFISNFSITTQYEDAYGMSIYYEGLDARDWRELCVQKGDSVAFLPSMRIIMQYSGQVVERDALSYLIPLWADTTYVGRIVFMIDMNAFISSALPDAIWASCPIALNSGDGGELWRGDAETGDEYTQITSNSAALNVSLVARYPDSLVREAISETLRITQWYMYISLFIAVLLAFTYTYSRFRRIMRLLEASAIDLADAGIEGNEYEYITQAINEMSTANDAFKEKIAALQRDYVNSLLSNLCLRGTYASEDISLLEGYLNRGDGEYYIAVMLLMDSKAALPDAATLRAQQLFAQALMGAAHAMLTERGAIVFLAAAQSVEAVLSALAKAVELFSAHAAARGGVSRAFTRLEDAHAAYEEASLAARICFRRMHERALAYQPSLTPEAESTADVGELTRLKELLYAGKGEEACELIERITAESARSRSPSQQAYYAVRMVIENAWRRFMPNAAFAPGKLAMPDLHACAKRVCEAVNEGKKSEREHMRRAIYDYIEASYVDPAFLAAAVAEHFALSDRYIFRFVKEHTGQSLSDLIEETRVKHAEEHLTNTDWSNEEIARQSGFGSINTFYRAFKKYHSVSPAVWRAMNSTSVSR